MIGGWFDDSQLADRGVLGTLAGLNVPAGERHLHCMHERRPNEDNTVAATSAATATGRGAADEPRTVSHVTRGGQREGG